MGYKELVLTHIADEPNESVSDCLEVRERGNIPSPQGDELLLRMRMSAIHPCDLLCCAGIVSRQSNGDATQNHRYRPGIEAVAEVVEAGEGLTSEFNVGERVIVKAWSLWGQWEKAEGVWAEYFCVKPDKVIRVPSYISDPNAALFISMSVTAYVMAIEQLKLKKGDWLMQAASGSMLGQWLIALAQTRGINLINLVRRQDQVEALKRETGAEHVYWFPSDGSQSETVVEAAWDLTGGNGIRGALDPISDGVFASAALRSMQRYGTLLKYGALGDAPMTLSQSALTCMSQQGLRIAGFSIQNWWMPDTPDAEKSRVFDSVFEALRMNPSLHVEAKNRFTFDQYREAIQATMNADTSKAFFVPS